MCVYVCVCQCVLSVFFPCLQAIVCVSFCLIKRARWCAFGVCMCRVPNSFLCTSCILLEPLHRPVTPVTCVCVCVCGCTCAVRVLRGVCVLFIHTNANKHTQDVSEEIPENTYVIPEGFSLWDAPPPSQIVLERTLWASVST